MRSWIALGFVLGIALAAGTAVMAMATAAKAQLSADVARQCRVMMLKAYPSHIYGTTGTAATQRAYFQECVKRGGKMDEGSDPSGAPDKDRH